MAEVAEKKEKGTGAAARTEEADEGFVGARPEAASGGRTARLNQWARRHWPAAVRTEMNSEISQTHKNPG